MSLFNGEQEPRHKIIEDYESLSVVVRGLWAMNYQVVFTIGSWDLLHIGHLRYLRKARSEGHVLVVGVDTDDAVKRYKGPLRPIVPYKERVEMLTYQSCVDLVTSVGDVGENGKWGYGLIQAINPDVFVAVENSYSQDQLEAIQTLCKRMVVLPRQAENASTTMLVQETLKNHLLAMVNMLERK